VRAAWTAARATISRCARVAGGLLHSADLGVGHRQQAGFDATGFEARGGVGEDEGAFLGEAE
jgi:hypothetical protein